MECKTEEVANVMLIRVEGRIDHTTTKDFENALLPQLEGCIGEERKALLDMSGVVYMSSAGLRVLMLAAKQCRKQQGEITIAALQPDVREVFRISRFDTVFKVFATVKEALDAMSPMATVAHGGEARD